MPGEVAAVHAQYERQCAKCHEPFDKKAQDRLCLACHEDVAADLTGKRGYHGREPSVGEQACEACHPEHEGRDAEIAPLDRHAFDHRHTDFPLQGAHVKVPCDDCHGAGTRYRETTSTCNQCHEREDPHEGSVGPACERCHDESAWKTVHFEHDAVFPLEGGHREVKCEECHTNKRYKPTPSECHTCHERDDRHRGGLGSRCQSCHTTRAWSATAFDHARQTTFPLQGRHARVACESCHRPGFTPTTAPTSCHGCHQDDDAHRGRFGAACEKCHSPDAWRRVSFDHARATGYPLRGRHAGAPCTACHRDTLYEKQLESSCVSCHRGDDVHRGSQGTSCDRCHDERGWSRGVLLDHDTTGFPLSGAHARATCMQCHTSSNFKNDAARDCVACHEKEDVHRGRLGPRCERCHDASSFKSVHEPR